MTGDAAYSEGFAEACTSDLLAEYRRPIGIMTSTAFPIVPDAELGWHHFRYAFLLHQGGKDLSHVTRATEQFNNPIALHGTPGQGPVQAKPMVEGFSFASTDRPNLTIATV